MRLDLPRYNCTAFSISSEFTVSAEDDAAIQASMMESMKNVVHEPDDGHIAAVFGSKSTVRGTVHQIQGILARNLRSSEAEYLLLIECEIAPDDLPRPPHEIRSITRLIDASADIFGELEIDCNATFVYDVQQGVHSRIALPTPLILPERDKSNGMTHIESLRLSRRVGNRLVHSVEIIPSESGDRIRHIVNYRVTDKLAATSVRRMLEMAGKISADLIVELN